LPALVRNMALTHGASIMPDAAKALIERVGTSTTAIDSSLAKLAAYVVADKRDAITRADIARLIAETTAAKAWEYSQAVLAKDLVHAQALRRRMPKESPQGLLAMSMGRLRDMVRINAYQERGMRSAASIAKQMGKPPWIIEKELADARRYKPGELEAMLIAAPQAMRQMNSGADPELALTKWASKAL
jgi:DNA polymerase-3 subunit delta